MINLVSEIAQYAVETDQVIRQLAKERDDLKAFSDSLTKEIDSLRRRIEAGMAENKKLLNELNAVRFPDKAKEQKEDI